MTDEVENVEADDDFFEEDLEDAQTRAAVAFEGGDIDDDDDLPIGELENEDDLPPRPGEQVGAEADPEADQDLGVREPEGDT